MLSAFVPRSLRVRGSIQIAGTRLPVRGFLVIVGCLFLSVLAIIFGAGFEPIFWVCGISMLFGLILVEGQLWGRTTPQLVRLLFCYLQRPKQLRCTRAFRTLPTEPAELSTVPSRRPRWQVSETNEPGVQVREQ